MSDFFEKLIDHELMLGTITDDQGDALRSVFGVLSEADAAQMQDLLTKEPKAIKLIIDNIGQKIQAVGSGDIEQWKVVVADEANKLDAFSDERAHS